MLTDQNSIRRIKFWVIILFLIAPHLCFSQKQGYHAIYSGVALFDNNGNIINAHGGCIIKEKGKYYLFGEGHTDTSNAFVAFNCYSSTDLYNWKFENQVLKVQASGILGRNRIGERIKVMKCPATGEFVMYMHTDDIRYNSPCIGYATSKTIAGDYVFKGPILFGSKPIYKWDMGAYQDSDGSGYILIHGGNIFKLAEDYKSIIEETLSDMAPETESPAIMKANNTYFWLGSSKTSWERNDNFYYTAKSLKGPWSPMVYFAPRGTLTYNSQTTFVLTIAGNKDTTFMYMGDRWSYPRQASDATYVWQPLKLSGASLYLPAFYEGWRINSATGEWTPENDTIPTGNAHNYGLTLNGEWHKGLSADASNQGLESDTAGALLTVKFKGQRIAIYGLSGLNGGYAKIELSDKNQHILYTSGVDFYSKYVSASLKYVSPYMREGDYTLTIRVEGDASKWANKAGHKYGSTGNDVTITRIKTQ
jgi:hypothetical protein